MVDLGEYNDEDAIVDDTVHAGTIAALIVFFTTSHIHHFWRPSTTKNNFLSPNLVEPVADVRLCCARAPAQRHVAPQRPRYELFTWQRLRCPKGSCIGKRGEGRWWVRSPANSRTSFSKGQSGYQKIGTESLEPFERLRGGASGAPRDSVPSIAVLELTSLCPLRPNANSSSLSPQAKTSTTRGTAAATVVRLDPSRAATSRGECSRAGSHGRSA